MHNHRNRRLPIILFIPKKMAETTRKYIFDKDYTAVQFQGTTTPPTNTSNKTYLKLTIIDGEIKTDVTGNLRVVSLDGYDVTDAVSLAPEVVVINNPPVIQPKPNIIVNPRQQPIFSRNEKRVMGFVLLVLVIVIIANEAK